MVMDLNADAVAQVARPACQMVVLYDGTDSAGEGYDRRSTGCEPLRLPSSIVVTKVLQAPSRVSRSGASGLPRRRFEGRPWRPRGSDSILAERPERRRQESLRRAGTGRGLSVGGGGECGIIFSVSNLVDSRTQCFIASSRREALNNVLP